MAGLSGGSSTLQFAPVPPVITAGVVSPSGLLASGELRRSLHRLETEKSLHFPVLEVLLLVVDEFVVDINMVTRLCENITCVSAQIRI